MSYNPRLDLLLEEEMAAYSTYEKALDKFLLPHQLAELKRIQEDHFRAARALDRYIPEGPPGKEHIGAWIVLSKAVDGVERLYGKMAAVRTLQEGEALAIKEWEECLADDNVPGDCKSAIQSTLLPLARRHVKVLERLVREESEEVDYESPDLLLNDDWSGLVNEPRAVAAK